MEEEYYLRFPSVLREALRSGKVSFDKETKFSYAPFRVFRGITREKGESLEIRREDFLIIPLDSYHESHFSILPIRSNRTSDTLVSTAPQSGT